MFDDLACDLWQCSLRPARPDGAFKTMDLSKSCFMIDSRYLDWLSIDGTRTLVILRFWFRKLFARANERLHRETSHLINT